MEPLKLPWEMSSNNGNFASFIARPLALSYIKSRTILDIRHIVMLYDMFRWCLDDMLYRFSAAYLAISMPTLVIY